MLVRKVRTKWMIPSKHSNLKVRIFLKYYYLYNCYFQHHYISPLFDFIYMTFTSGFSTKINCEIVSEDISSKMNFSGNEP